MYIHISLQIKHPINNLIQKLSVFFFYKVIRRMVKISSIYRILLNYKNTTIVLPTNMKQTEIRKLGR